MFTRCETISLVTLNAFDKLIDEFLVLLSLFVYSLKSLLHETTRGDNVYGWSALTYGKEVPAKYSSV